MTYKVNDTALLTQPTSGRWIPRESLGVDGNGQAVYPLYREFELAWDLIELPSASQLQNFFDAMAITGTVSIDLPKFNDSGTTSTFQTYSGCVLREPEFETYFESNRSSARLLVARIRVQ